MPPDPAPNEPLPSSGGAWTAILLIAVFLILTAAAIHVWWKNPAPPENSPPVAASTAGPVTVTIVVPGRYEKGANFILRNYEAITDADLPRFTQPEQKTYIPVSRLWVLRFSAPPTDRFRLMYYPPTPVNLITGDDYLEIAAGTLPDLGRRSHPLPIFFPIGVEVDPGGKSVLSVTFANLDGTPLYSAGFDIGRINERTWIHAILDRKFKVLIRTEPEGEKEYGIIRVTHPGESITISPR